MNKASTRFADIKERLGFEALCAGDLVTDRDASGQPLADDEEQGPTRSGFGEL